MTIGSGNSTRPFVRSDLIASKNADPSELTLKLTSSGSGSPVSARSEKPVLKAKAASFAAPAVLERVALVKLSRDGPEPFGGLVVSLGLGLAQAIQDNWCTEGTRL